VGPCIDLATFLVTNEKVVAKNEAASFRFVDLLLTRPQSETYRKIFDAIF